LYVIADTFCKPGWLASINHDTSDLPVFSRVARGLATLTQGSLVEASDVYAIESQLIDDDRGITAVAKRDASSFEYQAITTLSSRGVALWLFPKKHLDHWHILRYDDRIGYGSMHEKN
jgi:hypothetical protein